MSTTRHSGLISGLVESHPGESTGAPHAQPQPFAQP